MNADAIMAERFARLNTTRTTRRGNKYLLPPDHKDDRWGLTCFDGVNPITKKRAAKLLDKMEKWQAIAMSKPEIAGCPCCGHEPEQGSQVNGGVEMVNLFCGVEGCLTVETAWFKSLDGAITAWNRRSFCPDHEFCCNTCDHKCGIEIVEKDGGK